MSTLYLRNVPDTVSERLAALAAREGMSVSAFAVRELAEASRRAENPAILAALPDLGIDATSVVADVDAGRVER
ncbi:MAG: hypothetical protein WKF96_22330 [Solirubrobacteraceae bacterium]